MIHTTTEVRPGGRLISWAMLCGLLAIAGCASEKPPAPQVGYERYPLRDVPAFMQGTLIQQADMMNVDPYTVSGYGLVVGLPGTGGNQGIPSSVRDYMLDEMYRHGFSNSNAVDERVAKMKPEQMLDSNVTSVVEVIGLIPPGARQGQMIDLHVQTLTDSSTTSLAGGKLYRTQLRINGANPYAPRGSVNVYAFGQGQVFVNPAHAVGSPASQPSGTARASLRVGSIIGGGMVSSDRTLIIRLRQPELRLAHAVQERLKLAFPKTDDDPTHHASARDEALIDVLPPLSYEGDWDHFRGVVMHLYLDGSGSFAANKARELCAEAKKPNAPLMDISYCWEGLGRSALDYIPSLYSYPQADVAFAAARAGAFLGDQMAQDAVLETALNKKSPFQLDAVKVLGSLSYTPRIQGLLGRLLNSDSTLVRVEAYHILCRRRDAIRIHPEIINNTFVLDTIPSSGPPLIYASRIGTPRIAIFGNAGQFKLPIMFAAFNAKLTIASDDQDWRKVTVYYAGPERRNPAVAELSAPDLRELIWRLGGGSDDGFRFSYADLVGILQAMSDHQDIAAAFKMQDLRPVGDAINDAPVIPDRGVTPAGNSTAGVQPTSVQPAVRPH